MNEATDLTVQIMFQGVAIGIGATIAIDIWALVAKNVLRLPTANWAMVGRWFGHMRNGVFVHRPIAAAQPVGNELALGWIMHYLIGALYGLAYLVFVRAFLSGQPSLASALGFGLATLFAPWLIMQPAMGAGVFASRTPHPLAARITNLSMHALFGGALYAGWLLLR